MADTLRTKSYLLASVFQDGQAGGAITANDMRDLVVSMQKPFMGVYFSSSSLTTISGAGSYVKALGTTTVSNQASDMDANSVSNRIRYTGVSPRHFHVVAQASIELAAGSNQDIGLQVWRYDDSAASGALLPHSEARSTIGGTAVIQITTHADFQLETNDYIELHIANHTNTNNLTVTFGYLFATGMLI